ncbi:MAG: SMC-Scp complex subunit ScpB [bacterium]|nr:SMC-Scp complex subunit ScpB [bacterium]
MISEQNLQAGIEAILFVEAKSISFKRLAKWLNASVEDIKTGVQELSKQFEEAQHGLRILVTNDEVQMATAPEQHDLIASIIKDERTGELTKPSLETLAIIAYRNPVTKAELEMIRGVNCTLILRNLLIRGLITESFDKKRGIDVYDVTTEYLQLLGVGASKDLPNYEKLSRDITIGETLSEMEDPEDFFKQVEQIDEDKK